MVLILIIIFSLSFSADYIRGRIVNSDDNPIRNVNIQIFDSNLGCSSDEEGFFIIDLPPSFSKQCNQGISLKISHIKYIKKEIIDIGCNENVNITLFENSLKLDDIVITGVRAETYIKDSPVLTHVINSEDINNSVYSSVKDVLEMSLPNFQNSMWTHANFTSDRVKIQGLSDKYILFLIDGARVSGEFSGMLDFSMLDLSNVDKIEIVEGGMSSLYGSSAIGGVVNIITKKNNQKFTSSISYLYDSPIVKSKMLNLAFKFNALSYSVHFNDSKSNGYDLTLSDAVYSNSSGFYLKTLEKYSTLSQNHKLSYNFNANYFLELNYKDYVKDIFAMQKFEVPIDEHPFFSSYDALQHEIPKSEDYRFGILLKVLKNNSLFKISYNKEEYIKSNSYFNYSSLTDENNNSICITELGYCNNLNNLLNKEFINAIHINESMNFQFDKTISNHSITLGFEISISQF